MGLGIQNEPSKPVSRVLYLDRIGVVTIYLDRMLPYGSSGQPGDGPGIPIVPLFGLAPDGVFLSRPVTRPPVSSYLAISPLPPGGRYVSVALSVGSPLLGVTQHLARGARTFLPDIIGAVTRFTWPTLRSNFTLI